MTRSILIRHAGQLLTLAGPPGARRGAPSRDLGIVENGAVLVDAGRIVAAGPEAAVEELARGRTVQEIDARGRVVMPGFVDCHTHLIFGPPRLNDFEMRLGGADYHAIAAAGGGIRSTVRAVRGASAAELAVQARRRLEGFARYGTTTLEAKSGYGLDEEGERKTLRLLRDLDGHPLEIVATYLGAHITPLEYDGRPDDYIEWMIRHMLPIVRQQRLADFVDAYIDCGAFTCEQAWRYLAAARDLGFGLRVHAEQFSCTGAARLACELGAASADHLEQATEEDADALARSETIATLLPASVLHLALQRYAPARLLIDRGAAVALATDFNPGTSPTCSMPMVIALACRMMKMTIAEAITAATVNAAAAVRRSPRVGTLEPASDADLIILDAEDYRELAYWFGLNPVALTMKRGRVIDEENRPPDDKGEVRAGDAKLN
jgi:imidazolonepropionase